MLRPFHWHQTWLLWPAFGLLAAFFIWPTLDVVRASLFDPDFTLEHFERLVSRPVYLTVLLRTVWVALQVAVLCTLIGYPAAWIISRQPRQRQFLLLFALFVTMWMSVLIRSFAWVVVFGREGFVNTILIALHLIDEPRQMLYTSSAVLVAMVQVLLPLQIVTCLGAITEIDTDLVRAARVLGASRAQAFVRVVLPLSADGLATAFSIVFMMAMGFFITPALLGGRSDLLLGNLIEQQVGQLKWGFASALALALLATTLLALAAGQFLRVVLRRLRGSLK
jgi:putative spermidine/putrescine transport system permease protein